MVGLGACPLKSWQLRASGWDTLFFPIPLHYWLYTWHGIECKNIEVSKRTFWCVMIYTTCHQVKADPRSTYVRCLRVVRRSRVGVRRSGVNLTFWLCCYFLTESSLRQHCNTSRDWQWLGEIPCQIYIPESWSWSFPFVCKITRTGRSLPKFSSP